MLASSAQAQSVHDASAAPPAARRSFVETLRALPLGIQGMWLGLACIVLLVGSAAALRSLLESNVGAPGGPGVSASNSAAASSSSAADVGSAIPTAEPTPEPTNSSVSIGGAGMGGPSGPGGLVGFGALAMRDRMSANLRLRKIGLFLDDLDALLKLEPAAIDRIDLRKMIADAAMYSMVPGPGGALGPEAERMFTFLTEKAGPAGPDILYDLVSTRGLSKAASYAEELLNRPEIRNRGTPALRIVWELRMAPTCAARSALLPRVKAEGDRRALVTLSQMKQCGKLPTDCCLAHDPVYKDTLASLNAKK